MPQTKIVMGTIKTPGDYGALAGGQSWGTYVLMDKKSYEKDIDWETAIKYFFHEQGHEWQKKAESGAIATSYPDDVDLLRTAEKYYAYPDTSGFFYRNNPTELHAQRFEQQGTKVLGEWKKAAK